jgi:hypothetical protein
MSVSRKIVALAALGLATAATAVSFTGVASAATAPALPSAIVTVHADPGHISTRIFGTSCGGFIDLVATGNGGGYGMASCGHAAVFAPATPGGSFNGMFAPPAAAPLVCQANAQFASDGVTVTCFENIV